MFVNVNVCRCIEINLVVGGQGVVPGESYSWCSCLRIGIQSRIILVHKMVIRKMRINIMFTLCLLSMMHITMFTYYNVYI